MQSKLEKPVQGAIGTTKYQCNIEWRNGFFLQTNLQKMVNRIQVPILLP